jgi:hypothetical protein
MSSPDFAAKAELYRGQSPDDKLVQDGSLGTLVRHVMGKPQWSRKLYEPAPEF